MLGRLDTMMKLQILFLVVQLLYQMASYGLALDPCPPGCDKTRCAKFTPSPGALQTDISTDGQGGILATVGLEVPRGSGGREPGLALKYSNTAGNGWIGLGWKLSYFPTITRCPRKILENGKSAGVSLTSDDVYCVGGDQLIPVANSTTAIRYEGARYYSEKFDRIVYQPVGFRKTPNTHVTGPEYWIASFPNGVLRYFGNTEDSKISVTKSDGSKTIFAWEGNCEADPFGNSVNVTYENIGTEGTNDWYMTQILYAEGSASVMFDYVKRPDPIVSYFAGYRLSTSQLLSSIRTLSKSSGGSSLLPVLTYKFAYTTSMLSKISMLKSIQLCSGCFEMCQQPLDLAYFSPPPSAEKTLALPYSQSFVLSLPGFSDPDKYDPQPGGFHRESLCTIHDGKPFVYPDYVPANEQTVQLTVEANGDGKSDLLFAYYNETSGLGVTLLVSTGDGKFQAVSSDSRAPKKAPSCFPSPSSYCCAWPQIKAYSDYMFSKKHQLLSTSLSVFSNDITGDGFYDLTAVILTNGSQGAIEKTCPSGMPRVLIFFVAGKGAGDVEEQGNIMGFGNDNVTFNFSSPQDCSILVSDVTNDFYQDILITCADDKGWRVWTLMGTPDHRWDDFKFSQLIPGKGHTDGHDFSQEQNLRRTLTRDLNGDGSPDLLMVTAWDTGVFAHVSLSKSDGGFEMSRSITISSLTILRNRGELFLFFVDNRDTGTDLVVSAYDKTGWYGFLAKSKGDGTFTEGIQFAQHPNWSPGTIVAAADVNGDSRQELLAISPGNSTTGLVVQILSLIPDGSTGSYALQPYKNVSSVLSGKGFNETNSVIFGDFDGDAKPDIVVVRIPFKNSGDYCSKYVPDTMKVSLFTLMSTKYSLNPFDTLAKLENGHGVRTEVSFGLMTNERVYILDPFGPALSNCSFWPNLQAIAEKAENVIHVPSARFLVTKISRENGIASESPSSTGISNITYVYRGFARHTRGYGSLGFQYVFSYHEDTTLSQLTFHSLDFLDHMQGHPTRIETYKCTGKGPQGRSPVLLSVQTNTWELKSSYRSSDYLYGSYMILLTGQSQLTNSESTGVKIKQENKELNYDAYGLPVQTNYSSVDISPYSKGFSNLGKNSFTRQLSILHKPPAFSGYSWFVGIPDTASEVTAITYANLSVQANYTTSSTFKRAVRSFDSETGAVLSETLMSGTSAEPGNLKETLTVVYNRDRRGNIVGVSSMAPDGTATTTKTMTYDVNGRFQTSLCGRPDRCHQWTQGHNGEVLSEVSEAGETIEYQYDALYRYISAKSAFGAETKTSYILCNQSGSGCSFSAEAAYAKATTSVFGSPVYEYYDKLDRLLGAQWSLANEEGTLVQTNKYDSFGGLSERTPVHMTTDTAKATISYSKDQFGRVAIVNKTVLVGESTHWQALSMDYYGNRVDCTATHSSSGGSQQNQPWKQIRVADSRGLTAICSEPNIDHTLQYWHDSEGNLLAVVLFDKKYGQTILLYRAVFGSDGFPTGISHCDKGTYKYHHDSRGHLLKQTDASGNAVSIGRNAWDQVTSIQEDLASGELGFQLTVFYSEDFPDKIAKEMGTTGSGIIYSLENNFDKSGRLINVSCRYGENATEISYVYDSDNGGLKRVIYPGEFAVSFGYDGMNRLTSIADVSSQLWQAQAFDATGRVTKEQRANGLTTEKTYDPLSVKFETSTSSFEVKSILEDNVINMVQSEPQFAFSAISDATGKVATVQKFVGGRLNYSESLTYDQNFQALNETIFTSNEKSTNAVVSYSYGAFGNLVYKSDVGVYEYVKPSAINLAEPEQIHRLKGFEYDTNGNRKSWNGTTVTYNSRNKPVTITRGPFSVSFEYSPRGKLVMRKDSLKIALGVTDIITVVYRQTWYPDDLYEVEFVREDLSSPVMTKKIERFFINSEVVRQQTTNLVSGGSPSAAYLFLYYDTKGSLSVVTDQTGKVQAMFDYDVCGRRRDLTTGKPSSRYSDVMKVLNRSSLTEEEAKAILSSLTSDVTVQIGFDGHMQLDDIGGDLVHMGGRLFDTIHCLFLTPDPYVSDRWRAVGYNSYVYGEFNPMAGKDPSGYSFWSSIGHFFKSLASKIAHLIEKIIDGLATLLRKIPILNRILTLAIDVLAEATGEFWITAAWQVVEGRVHGESWADSLIDGLTKLASSAIGALIDTFSAATSEAAAFEGAVAKGPLGILKKIVKTALDGVKGAVEAAINGKHSFKAIMEGALRAMVKDIPILGKILGPKTSHKAPSVTYVISYNNVPSLHVEVGAVAKVIARSVINDAAIAAVQGLIADGQKSSLYQSVAAMEENFIKKGMLETFTLAKTDKQMLWTDMMHPSPDHSVFGEYDSQFGSTKLGDLFGESRSAGKILEVDAMANIDKLSGSRSRGYAAMHNADIVRSCFAGSQGKNVRDELFFFQNKRQLTMAVSVDGKTIREWQGN
eukprot:m.307089 g.307089  ORF g.307089 m.307089 type:complete len:2421 (+) comp41894_c0_seq1:200-7462(+)